MFFRDEPLQFTLMGGHEKGFGIFIDKVEKGTKAAEIGLKRGKFKCFFFQIYEFIYLFTNYYLFLFNR